MTRRLPKLVIGSLAMLCTQHSIAQCREAPTTAMAYAHDHEVYNFNGEPPTRMEDTLHLWNLPSGEQCFDLDTWGSNGHECEVRGALEALSEDQYRFVAGECSITITRSKQRISLVAGQEWRRSGAGGACPRRFGCGMFGSIESGLFLPPASAENPKVVFYLDENYNPQARVDRLGPLTDQMRAILAMYALQNGAGCKGLVNVNPDPDNPRAVSCVLTESLGLRAQCSAAHIDLVRRWFEAIPKMSGYADRLYSNVNEPGNLESICYCTPWGATFQHIWEIIKVEIEKDTVHVTGIVSWLAREQEGRVAYDSVFRLEPASIAVVSHSEKELAETPDDADDRLPAQSRPN